MADNWPASLPQKLQVGGFNEVVGSSTLISENEVGPSKRRRRNTAEPDPIRGTMIVDFTQRETIKAFYKTTLGGGVLPFTFPDPYTGTDTDYTFLSPPSFTALGGGELSVALEWESVP